jgi:hypothetical protein
MGGTGSGPRPLYDLEDVRDRRRLVAIYREVENEILANKHPTDASPWAILAKRAGVALSTVYRYLDENESFRGECEKARITEKINFEQKVHKGCFNEKGEIIAQNVVIRLMEKMNIIDKESKGPSTAIQVNGGGIQVAFVEPNAQLVEATDGQEA